MAQILDEIIVNAPIKSVFRTVTDLNQLSSIFPDLSEIKAENMCVSHTDQRFSATKTIHGRSQNQKFLVTCFEPPHRYEFATTLFNLPVVYSYEFKEQSGDKTLILLKKNAKLTGWTVIFAPLMRHLFSKPEHDQHHLRNLAQAVENGERGR